MLIYVMNKLWKPSNIHETTIDFWPTVINNTTYIHVKINTYTVSVYK